MKIDTQDIKVIFEFSPRDYFLVYSLRDNTTKEWSLNNRIDRSDKGKFDDVGDAVIYLTSEQAEECKKAGFSYIEI